MNYIVYIFIYIFKVYMCVFMCVYNKKRLYSSQFISTALTKIFL